MEPTPNPNESSNTESASFNPPVKSSPKSKRIFKFLGLEIGIIAIVGVLVVSTLLFTNTISLSGSKPSNSNAPTSSTQDSDAAQEQEETSSQTSSTGKKTFIGDRMTFQYPTTWYVDGATSLQVTFLPLAYEGARPTNQPDGTVYILVKESADDMYGFFTPGKVSDLKSVTLDGAEAKALNAPPTYEKPAIVVAKRNGMYYTLALTATDANLVGKYVNDFDELVRSFKFTTPIVSTTPTNTTPSALIPEFLTANEQYVSLNKKLPCTYPASATLNTLSPCLDELITAGELKGGFKSLPELGQVTITYDATSKTLQGCTIDGKSCQNKVFVF